MPLPRRRLLRGLLAGPILVPILHRTAQAQGALWTMATGEAQDSATGESIAFFAERLGEESGRRLMLLPSYDGAFGVKAAEIARAIADGKLAAGAMPATALESVDPLFCLSGLPFAMKDDDDARAVLGRARDLYARRLAREGQRLLYAVPLPAMGLWGKRPIRNPSDIIALKLGAEDAAGRAVFDAAHADVGSFSGNRREAELAPADEASMRKIGAHLPCFTNLGYAVPLCFATLATPLYDRLPDALREAVDRAAVATQENAWRVLARRRAETMTRLRDGGITVAEVSPELRAILARAAARTIAKWQTEAGPEAAALLK
ncbi:MAG: hypothetical protein JSR24_03480 [Proteobacteria bacterium]|nr:hypothetical protein [Pseudomonadota bacterium]